MTNRTEAQRRADAAYAGKTVQIKITLTAEEAEAVEALDIVRGDRTRASYTKQALLHSLGLPMKSTPEDFEEED